MSNKVFLANTASDCQQMREELAKILVNAGLDVHIPGSQEECLSQLEGNESIQCSIHILGNQLGEQASDQIPYSLKHIQAAKGIQEKNKRFKIFVWNIGGTLSGELSPEQQRVINDIRNGISGEMVFTNVPSPVQLVDDIRSMLSAKVEEEEEADANELFFMYNFLDEELGEEITEMLTDILKVEKLIIGEQPGVDYGTASIKILKNSRLAVVFFSEATAWAMPFIQQIWKMSGGASSKTPIMLIGDEEQDDNASIQFNAPNVTFKLVPTDLIPLEVKVAYDKVTGNA